MRTTIPLQSTVSRNRIAPESSPASALNRLTVLAAILSAGPLLFGVPALTAQAPSASSAAHVPSTAAHKSAHAHSRPSPRHPQTPPTQTPPETVVLPPPPEIPHWPANEQPAEAFVAWDSQGLRINAANSSLEQIMKDVSTATGAKVEGLGNDQRVFGAYGPGQARDVLSQLLQGSGYNVLMIGDQGQGAPREIMLTLRQAAGAQPPSGARTAAPPADEDSDLDEPPPQQEGNPMRPGAQPRTPQQIQQEMQQRQQQIQQHQQGLPPNQLPTIPPN